MLHILSKKKLDNSSTIIFTAKLCELQIETLTRVVNWYSTNNNMLNSRIKVYDLII